MIDLGIESRDEHIYEHINVTTAYQRKWYVAVRSLHPDFADHTERMFPANQAK